MSAAIHPAFRTTSEMAAKCLETLYSAEQAAAEGRPDDARVALGGVVAWCAHPHTVPLIRAMVEDLAAIRIGPLLRVNYPLRQPGHFASAHEAVAELFNFVAAWLLACPERPELSRPGLLDYLGLSNPDALRAHLLDERARLLASSPDTTPEPAPSEGPTADRGPKPADTKPRKPLSGWHEITAALDMRYADRKKIISPNARFGGPIKCPGVGRRPAVYRDVLLEWFNNIDVLAGDMMNQQAGRNLAAEAQHNYGRDGTAAPEVGGGMRKRRRDRKT